MFGRAEILRLRLRPVLSRAEGMTVLDGQHAETSARAGSPGTQPSIIANKANMQRFWPKNEGRGANEANVRGRDCLSGCREAGRPGLAPLQECSGGRE